ncbi:hypothetical protein AK830_g3603 [Neonectria ditissima]|uniref:Transcription factor domain-containing protein n=1 Tax=Neonectria ditissima TaxID=78410 RepID=A0A0P7B8C3_9HYPO|nr:hypothetical protein AK830_g3603 [Neonectria ditissima]
MWDISSSSVIHSEPLGSECRNDVDPYIPPALLPHRDANHAIRFYMNAWKSQCIPALHVSFHRIEPLCRQSSLLKDIMATLSACRLSRTLPQRKLFKISDAPGLGFRPDSGHEYLSGELYGSALRKMAWWSHQEFDSHPTLGLAVLVLFCYLESSMGNFQEFRLHSEGVENLVKNYTDCVNPHGVGLLAAWVEVKMQNWWRRAYFGVPDLHRDYSVPLICPELEATLTTANDRRASILWILCESHRLNTAAIVACWDVRMGHSQTTAVGGVDSTVPFENITEGTDPRKRIARIEYMALMNAQIEKLDHWYASHPPSEISECMEHDRDQEAFGSDRPEIEAIHFKSHYVAMNFAYYVTARVMQCTAPLQSFEDASVVDIDQMYAETESWVRLLLRIAAGINWKDCIRLNVYTIGLAGLLLACALRSRSLAAGIWTQGWLEERLRGDGFEEGNFPVFQILDALRLINRERGNGRDVVSLFQTVNDGGGSGKFGSYHSQMINSLLVFGTY